MLDFNLLCVCLGDVTGHVNQLVYGKDVLWFLTLSFPHHTDLELFDSSFACLTPFNCREEELWPSQPGSTPVRLLTLALRADS